MYSLLDLENSFLLTPSFIDWWIKYYKSQHQKILVCKDILITNFTDPSLQKGTALSKTKGTHVREILKFERFFKVKCNPRAVLRLVWDAMNIFKQKNEQHEGRCCCAFGKAKSFNPFTRHQSYITPFLFPLLSNAPFPIADWYSNPSQGPLDTLYLHPRHKAGTFTSLYLSKMTEHLIQSQSRVLDFPPLGSLLSFVFVLFLNSVILNYFFCNYRSY